ncbi:MAG: DVUA0089 family protein [Cyanobacteria bacterium P01_E01_bin.35]
MKSPNSIDKEELLDSSRQNQDLEQQEIQHIPSQSDPQGVLIDNQAVQLQQANSLDNPAFELIGLTQLRNDPQFAGIDGSGLSVAIIDTGIDREHPLIAPNYVTGYDFIDNDQDPADSNGHGTHVAGIIGAVDESIGIAPDVGLISLRALGNNDGSFFNKLEDSLEWVYANKEEYNITAVNLSFGVGFYTPQSLLIGDIISDDIRRLEEAGVTVIAATGNSYFENSGEPNQANITFPAITSTIAVGAVWQDGTQSNAVWQSGSIDYTTGADRIVSFSQRLDAPNVLFAPGAIITSTKAGGGISHRGGTSQAAPHVAGAVALLQEASLQFSDRLLTPEEVNEILRTTGKSIIDGDDEDDNNVSHTNDTYIRIDLYAAVAEVKRRSGRIVLPPPESIPVDSSPDTNGTIARAMKGPVLDGSAINPIRESIGFDGIVALDNDVDFYSFQVVSPGIIKIELTSNLFAPDDFDSYLQLFDSSGTQLAANDNIAVNNTFSQIEVSLDPDIYFVGVSGSNNTNYDPNEPGSGTAGDTGSYTLEFSHRNSKTNDLLINNDDLNLNPDNEVVAETAVHRFLNLETGIHFYTASIPERDFVQNNLNNYRYEGTSFGGAAEVEQGAKPVFRLFNTSTGGHFYTMSEEERDLVLDNLPTYNYEGIAYYGYESDRPGATPLYRLYNSKTDAHFYTHSLAERDGILTNLPHFQLENQDGIAYYVESLSIN